jgi:hypothetical protein
MGGAATVAMPSAGSGLPADEFVIDGVDSVEGFKFAFDFHCSLIQP